MKRSLLWAVTAILALGLLGSCEMVTGMLDGKKGTKTEDTVKAVAKLMVDLPKSLTSKATKANVVSGRDTAAIDDPTAGDPTTGDPTTDDGSDSSGDSIGFEMIQNAVEAVKAFVPTMSQYNAMVDAVIDQNDLKPSAATVSGKSIKVTQSMIDEMKASVPEELLADAGLPAVGKELTLPDFTYNTSTNANFAFSFATTDADSGMTMTFYWNNDKTRFGMSMEMSGMTMTLANDADTKSTVMSVKASGLVYDMKFRASSGASSLDGVYVSTVVDMGNSGKMDILGYADDNGGAVKFTSSSMNYTEKFGADGNLTYQGYSDGTTTTNVVGTPTDSYNDNLSNEDWGKAPTLL